MNAGNDPVENLKRLVRTSVTLKLFTIAIVILLLLIPTVLIEELIREREQISSEVNEEVSSKWADAQQFNGPILSIPCIKESEHDDEPNSTIYWHLLPENLNIEGTVLPEKLKRGIYNVIVYNSNLNVSGSFVITDPPDLQNLKEIQYDKAFITVGISDLRGVQKQVTINWAGEGLITQPGSRLPSLVYSGITIDIPNLSGQLSQELRFDFSLDLRGSGNISFIPLGKVTSVELKSPWPFPSFNGSFLPVEREVKRDGFSASWSVLQLNRNYPQNWIGEGQVQPMQESSFGVDLLLSLGNYQKAVRSIKYAILTISLTFLVFFLVEVRYKRNIHPFQYILVGFALCLFYMLLVSISEHANFNFAYAVSTVGTVLMISLYSLSVFKRLNLTLLLMIMLAAIYGFIFVTLQLTDYALLLGSIGLTLILAMTMYYTRNIDWYISNTSTDKEP